MLIYIIIIWVVCAIIGCMVGSSKGESGNGFALGFMLGPLGIIIVALMQGDRKKCAFCVELMQKEAVVCPHCQKEVARPDVVVPVFSGKYINPGEIDDSIKAMREALNISNKK